MTTDRTIEATTDGARIHVRIFPPFPGAAPLSLDEAHDLARQLLAVLPPLRAAAVAREALALDAVRAAEQQGASTEAASDPRAASEQLSTREPSTRDDQPAADPNDEQPTAEQQLAFLAAQHVRGGRLTFTRLDGDDVQVDDRHEGTVPRSWTGSLIDWEQALFEAVRERDSL